MFNIDGLHLLRLVGVHSTVSSLPLLSISSLLDIFFANEDLTDITSCRKISFARSFAAFMAAVMLPPARPAAYARSMHGYLTRSGSLNVKLAAKM